MTVSKTTLQIIGLMIVTAWFITVAVIRQVPRLGLQERALGEPGFATAGMRPLAINTIRVARPYREQTGTMRYYTGGHSRGTLVANAPLEVTSRARHGQVGVEVKVADNAVGIPDAQLIARTVAAATQEIWPQTALPVEVELHLMQAGAAYSFERRINWREGVPYYVTLFVNAGNPWSDPGRTAAHELYHILAARWRLGSNSPHAVDPAQASVLEETTAYLYGYCAELALKQTLTPIHLDTPMKFSSAGEEDRTLGVPFNASEALYVLGRQKDQEAASLTGEVLAYSMLKAIMGAQVTITSAMPETAAVKDLCRQAAANPFYLLEYLNAAEASGL